MNIETRLQAVPKKSPVKSQKNVGDAVNDKSTEAKGALKKPKAKCRKTSVMPKTPSPNTSTGSILNSTRYEKTAMREQSSGGLFFYL